MTIDPVNGLGTGFKAKVLETGLKNGALKVELEPGKELLRRSESHSSGEVFVRRIGGTIANYGRKQSFVADVFDFDGQMSCGNGLDLGLQTVRELDSMVVLKGNWVYLPDRYSEGGGGTQG